CVSHMPVPAAADERSGRKAHPHTSLSLNSQPPEIFVSSFAPRTRAGRELDAPSAEGQKPSGLNRIPEFQGVRQTAGTPPPSRPLLGNTPIPGPSFPWELPRLGPMCSAMSIAPRVPAIGLRNESRLKEYQ